MSFAQAWILTVEMSDEGQFYGLLTVSGDTTPSGPESYESFGLSRTILEELGSVLDATMWSFLAIADGTHRVNPSTTFIEGQLS